MHPRCIMEPVNVDKPGSAEGRRSRRKTDQEELI
jgi:hypothetical protein